MVHTWGVIWVITNRLFPNKAIMIKGNKHKFPGIGSIKAIFESHVTPVNIYWI